MVKLTDLTGLTFGRWTVIKRDGCKSPPRWWCYCSCGVRASVPGHSLRKGISKSCGCVGAERFKKLGAKQKGDLNPGRIAAKKRHGQILESRSPWYLRASSIKQKCLANSIEFGFSSITDLAVYLSSIAPKVCPVFGFELKPGPRGFDPHSPSADRIDPTLGYVRGNIQIISLKANVMKANATKQELRAFAEWVLQSAEQL